VLMLLKVSVQLTEFVIEGLKDDVIKKSSCLAVHRRMSQHVCCDQ
jgi:hypothetical protein